MHALKKLDNAPSETAHSACHFTGTVSLERMVTVEKTCMAKNLAELISPTSMSTSASICAKCASEVTSSDADLQNIYIHVQYVEYGFICDRIRLQELLTSLSE